MDTTEVAQLKLRQALEVSARIISHTFSQNNPDKENFTNSLARADASAINLFNTNLDSLVTPNATHIGVLGVSHSEVKNILKKSFENKTFTYKGEVSELKRDRGVISFRHSLNFKAIADGKELSGYLAIGGENEGSPVNCTVFILTYGKI